MEKDYKTILDDARNHYRELATLFSPALKQTINFNAKGFNHIIHMNGGHERNRTEQIRRFGLLPLAVKLIGLTNTYQEYEETIKEVQVVHNQTPFVKGKKIWFWGLIAIIDGKKIKVILRKIGEGGSIHFWSIIPSWKTNKRDGKFFNMRGNPFED